MKNSPKGKELHHPVTTWSYFQRSVDSQPHSHPFQTGCIDPQCWETSMAPFDFFNLNCSGSLLSHSLFIPVPWIFFSSMAAVECPASPACWDWESPSSPWYTPAWRGRHAVTQGSAFWPPFSLQPWLPITDVHSFVFTQQLMLLGPSITLSIFVLPYLWLCTSTSPHWLWHPLLAAQTTLFSVLCRTRCQQMTTHTPLMSFHNLTMLNMGQNLTPIAFLVDTLLFCFPSTSWLGITGMCCAIIQCNSLSICSCNGSLLSDIIMSGVSQIAKADLVQTISCWTLQSSNTASLRDIVKY